jgi:MFS family permease
MERRIIVSGALAHGTTHALELTFAALLLRIGADFGLELAALGAIATVGTVTFGMTALPSGFLVDRFGPKVVISSCMAAAAVFALLVAASPNVAMLAVSLALLGAVIGFYHPAGTAMVSTVLRRRGLAFAAHGIAGNLGVALIPGVAIGISILFDWRAAYALLGIVSAVVGLVAWRMAPNESEWAERVRKSAAAAEEPESTGRRSSVPPAVRSWFSKPLLLVYVLSIGLGFIYRGSLTFLAAHLEENLNVSLFGWSAEAVAGTFTSLVLLTAILGQAAGGYMSDRTTAERAAVPVFLAGAPLLLMVSFSTGVPLLLFTAGFVFANFAQQPIINGLIADYAPPGNAGRAFGVMFLLVFGVGSVAGYAAGLIADRTGTEGAFQLLAAVSLGLIVLSIGMALAAERRRRMLDSQDAFSLAAGG